MYTNTHLSFKEENSKTNNARTFSLEQNMISLHCIHAAVIPLKSEQYYIVCTKFAL